MGRTSGGSCGRSGSHRGLTQAEVGRLHGRQPADGRASGARRPAVGQPGPDRAGRSRSRHPRCAWTLDGRAAMATDCMDRGARGRRRSGRSGAAPTRLGGPPRVHLQPLRRARVAWTSVGWHALTGSLVIIEVKSRLLDLQDLLASLGRKIQRSSRIESADERGWDVVRVGGRGASRDDGESRPSSSGIGRSSTPRSRLRASAIPTLAPGSDAARASRPSGSSHPAVWLATKRPRRVRPPRSEAPQADLPVIQPCSG